VKVLFSFPLLYLLPAAPAGHAPCRTFPRPLRVRARAHPKPFGTLTRRNHVPRDPAQGNNGPAELVLICARALCACARARYRPALGELCPVLSLMGTHLRTCHRQHARTRCGPCN